MKLRTQLVIVFLLLSILPLAGIVLFSYSSSQRVFRGAVEKETRALAAQMDTRMAGIRGDLDRRMERIGVLPLDTLVAASDSGAHSSGAAAVLAAELGDSVEFLDRLEWAPGEAFDEFTYQTGDIGRIAPPPVTAPVAPTAAVPPPQPRTFVIEIPRIEVGSDGKPVVVGSERRTITTPPGLAPEKMQVDVTKAVERARRAAEASQREAAIIRNEIEKQREHEAIRREVSTPVVRDGSSFGVITAQVREDVMVRRVLSGAAPESDDVAFAIDDEGNLLAASDEATARLAELDLSAVRRGAPLDDPNWVVATSIDDETGLIFGVARPVRDSLRQMRANAMNNFAWGLGLVTLALFVVVPVANHLTRDIAQVMEGVDRIGHGDLETPVPVGSGNEIGRLASAFNRMAHDLKDQQQRLIEEERRRQEREIEQRMLEAEYQRKSGELEDARRFQLSLLPDSPPTHPDLDIAVHVRTATEVGGDYYDYHSNSDGSLTLVLGDATGHGARSGTMVTVVKSLFAGKAEETGLAQFLQQANHTIRQMKLERMAMALTIARYDAGRFSISSAGMPPVLLHRKSTGLIEELQLEAPPLGSLSHTYDSMSVELADGDLLLMMTDGYPELESPDGEPLGYVAAANLLSEVASFSPSGILARFADEAVRWSAGRPQSDDMTFIAIRVSVS